MMAKMKRLLQPIFPCDCNKNYGQIAKNDYIYSGK